MKSGALLVNEFFGDVLDVKYVRDVRNVRDDGNVKYVLDVLGVLFIY